MPESLIGLTGDTLLQAGGRSVEKLEYDLSQLLKWYDKIHAINELSVLRYQIKFKGPWPSHYVARLICAVSQYGTRNGKQISRDGLVDAINRIIETGNPAHMIVLSDQRTVELFGQLVGREQFPFQTAVTSRDVGRAIWLFKKLLPQPAQLWLEKKLKTNIQRSLLFAGMSAKLLDDGSKNLLFNGTTLANSVKAGFGLHEVMAVLRTCSAKPEAIKSILDNQYESVVNRAFLWTGESPLARYPMVRLSDWEYRSPFPNMIFPSFYRRLGDHLRSDKKHSTAWGVAFSRYIELVIGDLGADRVLYPDREVKDRPKCDFIFCYKDFDLYVESKSTRFSRNIITKTTIENDTSTGEIARGCVQIANSVMDGGRPSLGVVVIDDDLSFANSRWYRSRILSRNRDAAKSLRALGSFPNVWSLDVLEKVVGVSVETGLSLFDLNREYCNDNYNQYGDWGTWLGHKYPGVSAKKLDWISGVVRNDSE